MSQMNKELKLQIPDSLHSTLAKKAENQGVSIEALCLSMLQAELLVEPSLYGSLPNGQIRLEIKRVIESDLPPEEVRKRVRQLETQITRCIR